MKITCSVPTDKFDKATHKLLMEQKEFTVNDLHEALSLIGRSNFLNFMPIKYIEEFLNLPDINITDYLNNFHCYLPGGSSYELANGLKSSVVVRASPQQMFKCFFAANAKSEKTKKFAMDTRFYSDKRLHQTDNQFFLTIDEAVRACGSVSDIEKWREEYVAFDHEKLNEFHKKVLPIYFYLRKQGYTHRDLGGI